LPLPAISIQASFPRLRRGGACPAPPWVEFAFQLAFLGEKLSRKPTVSDVVNQVSDRHSIDLEVLRIALEYQPQLLIILGVLFREISI
jgi:hypothetical protein